MEKPVEKRGGRRIIWVNVMTVLSAAILIGAEVFGAAFAGGWAIGNLFDLGPTGDTILRGLLFALGMVVMVAFIRNAQRVEPFTQPTRARTGALTVGPSRQSRLARSSLVRARVLLWLAQGACERLCSR